MKIAILSRVIFLSGVTTHLIDLSNEFIKRGHEVFLFTRGPEYPESQALVDLYNIFNEIGVTIINISYPLNSKSKLKYLVELFFSSFQTNKMLKKLKIEVIHVHTPALSIILKIFNKKFIKTTHVKGLSLSFLNQKATHEIAISREIYNESVKLFNYTPNEISLIFNGVNSNFSKLVSNQEKKILKNKFKIPSDKIIIGIVGSIDFRKGHDVLLKSIASLNKKLLNNIHIIVLGSGLPKGEIWLKELIIKYSFQNLITKFDFQKPKQFYDMMDIFVLPSRLEGFPLVSIEAMLSGCCVVRSKTEGAFDQMIDLETGCLFKSEDYIELNYILKDLIVDVKKRISIASKGREYAINNFTSNIMAEKTLRVYEELIKK
ncbi:MAG: glycosyltransferase family 4 protein [Lutibacter sp.]|uniref:glycosyltransferase family 4 protein n=1 Tax=Lutibacter sp. TaxID=1925666 RepID=UPI00385D749B